MHLFRFLAVLTFAAILGGCQVSDEGSQFSSDSGNEGSSQGNSASNGSNGTSDQTRSVSLYWFPPLERVNGEPLQDIDIAGYEIRYRAEGESTYQRVTINGANTTQFHIDDLPAAEYRFELATIDSNGLYSDFVVAAR